MSRLVTELIREKRVYFDGGTGTCLQAAGLPCGTAPEEWNLTNPDKIRALHEAYLDAGCDIIKTNTFGVNSLKYPNYRDYVEGAISAAKLAVSGRDDKYIALDIGPTGRLLEPLGDLSFEDAVDVFRDTISYGASLGVDLILIETMNDSYETKAAVIAAKECSDLPIFVTNVYDESGKLMTGATPEAMISMLESLGVSALGANCSLGPDKMLSLLPRFLENASVPIIMNPNAGLPEVREGKTVFNTDKAEYATLMKEMAELGASVLGGCCGTTPEYIREMISLTKSIPCKEITEKNITSVSSYTHAVVFSDKPVLIGERINPTGKSKLKEALRTSNINYILGEAVGETDAGADILDVNVGLPEIDEVAMMKRCIYEIQAVTHLPLQIDSSNPEALEGAMRIYNGKALVNSVNAKRESMDKIFPLVKKYGGALIALTLDESGIPESAEGRVLLAEKIIAEAEKWGISKKDIIVDPLALSVSADKNAATVTLRSVRLLTERGIKTSLGVSNVSFGLPERERINSAFFTAALTEGLSAAIINPYSEAMLSAYRAYNALSGADVGCAEYISSVSGVKSAPVSQNKQEITLKYAVRRGMKEAAVEAARTLLVDCDSPLSLIDNEIIPALNEVGEAFEVGRAFLPELLMCAEAAGVAFDVIKEKMPKSTSGGEKIILATVKGDIHDIGKNIVRVMLESYGFTVYDLGRDVAPEVIRDKAKEIDCRLVGLSALMTTTVPSMKDTVDLIHKELPNCRVIVGGAVLTEDYAKMINADFYGKDAMETVRIAEKLFRAK